MLAAHTTGHRRGVLPHGVLQKTYPLTQDSRQRLHGDPHCPWARGTSHTLVVAPQEITRQNECACIGIHQGSPADLRALERYSRWDVALQAGEEGLDDCHLVLLHDGWRRLHRLLRGIRRGMEVEHSGANSRLNGFLTSEHKRAQELEEALRARLRAHGREHLDQEDSAEHIHVSEGKHLVASEILGVARVFSEIPLLLTVLQVDGIDPFSGYLVGEASGEVLAHLLTQYQEHHLPMLENDLTHVVLVPSDTPTIRETARSLWNPSISISDALEMARCI